MTPILVCGMSRCGTSLVMKMLHRGGVDVFADNHSAYESEAFERPREIAPALSKVGNRAVKVLDPHRWRWPEALGASVIWLDRDSRQQAKSIAKFLREIGGITVPSQAWRDIERGLRDDLPVNLALFAGLGCGFRRFTFESILAHPLSAAHALSLFLERDMDINAMASVVIQRSPKCAEGMDIEIAAVVAEYGR